MAYRQNPTIYPFEGGSKGSGKRHHFPGMGRTFAIQAMQSGKAIACFRCPECETVLPLTYSTLVVETSRMFCEPFHVCKDCVKGTKYTKV